MRLYVKPPESVERAGRPIELKETLEETRSQLNEDEEVCALTKKGFAKVALVVKTDNDHNVVVHSERDFLLGVFAIPKSLVPSTS